MLTRNKLKDLLEKTRQIDPYSYYGGIESDLSACQGAIRDIRLILEDLIQEQIDEIDERREAEDGY